MGAQTKWSAPRFFVLCLLLLMIPLSCNMVQLLYRGYDKVNRDPFSDNLILEDIRYRNEYGKAEGEGSYILTHFVTRESAGVEKENDMQAYVLDGGVLEKEWFNVYTSNTVIQRAVFLPLNGLFGLFWGPSAALKATFAVGQWLHCLLLAGALSYILLFFARYCGRLPVLCAVVVLAFACPHFVISARHLYWGSYQLLLPMAGSVFVLRRQGEGPPRKGFYALSFGVMLAACLYKQLMSVELITVVLVAAMVPYVFVLGAGNLADTWKERLKVLLVPSVGGILSIPVAFGIRTAVLVLCGNQPDFGSALQASLDPYLRRSLAGTSGEPLEMGEILHFYLDRKLIALPIGGWTLTVNMYGVLALLAALTLAIFLLRKKAHFSRADHSLLFATWVSLLAPFSWLLLAFAHSRNHKSKIIFIWYMPFLVLAFVLFFYCGRKLFAAARARLRPKQI